MPEAMKKAAIEMQATQSVRERERAGSLFDGLLQSFIRECDFDIPSGSEAETNLDIIKEDTPDPVVETDGEGKILWANAPFRKLLAEKSEELQGRSLLSLVSSRYRHGLGEALQRAASEKVGSYVDSVDDIVVFRSRGNTEASKSLEGIFYPYKKEEETRLFLLIRDLTYSRSLFEELQKAKENYDALSETIGETIIRLDEDFIVIFVNSAVRKTFGYEKQEVLGQHFSLLFPPGVFARNASRLKKYFYVDDQDRHEQGMAVTIEVLGKSKNRGIFPMEMSFGNSKDQNGRTITCILRDITQRKHNERRLRHLAYHDKLTGLGNRDLFNSDVRALLKTIRSHREIRSALMFLDLDGFKEINDTLGHEAGDQLLVEMGRRLTGSLRETDSAYRFGGDEFVVLLNRIRKKENAGTIARKLLEVIREPLTIEREENSVTVRVGVSIGIALIPENGDTPEELTKNADLAMYSAKEAGKRQYRYYSDDLDLKALEKWKFEQDMRAGLANREFLLHFQPLVNGDGGVQGAEALVRWMHPEKGLVYPGRFIPAAEETGLIIPMGNWILETACRTMRKLNESGYPDLYISVNVSPRQFDHPQFLNSTSNIIRRTGIDTRNLKLELTESCIMRAPETAIEKMSTLKAEHPGLTIAVDDFGTGYSSLSYLSMLPVDVLKIDLSFVSHLFLMNNRKIVNAIINLAKSLQLELVAEGVETREQRDYFVQNGCPVLQGKFFSMGLEHDALLTLLRDSRK
jgi:diguanylate cyclase (GGDEF)-like protein/PAS domain S-box-containing protein